MKTSTSIAMADLPEDLSDVGIHRGNDPEPETGQTVRSPAGPDPNAMEARPASALFVVVRTSSGGRLSVRAHSARADVPAPDDGDEVGRCRSVDALREILADAGIDESVAVFEDAQANRVLVDEDITVDHAWIGQPRYPRITFFRDPDEASAFAEDHERPALYA